MQWLRLCTYNAGDTGSVPGLGGKTSHAVSHYQKVKKKLKKICKMYLERKVENTVCMELESEFQSILW